MERGKVHYQRTQLLLDRLTRAGEQNAFSACCFVAYVPEGYEGNPALLRYPSEGERFRYCQSVRRKNGRAPEGLSGCLMGQFPGLWPKDWEFIIRGGGWPAVWPSAPVRKRNDFNPEVWGTGEYLYRCNYAYYPGADFLGLSRTAFRAMCRGIPS